MSDPKTVALPVFTDLSGQSPPVGELVLRREVLDGFVVKMAKGCSFALAVHLAVRNGQVAADRVAIVPVPAQSALAKPKLQTKAQPKMVTLDDLAQHCQSRRLHTFSRRSADGHVYVFRFRNDAEGRRAVKCQANQMAKDKTLRFGWSDYAAVLEHVLSLD